MRLLFSLLFVALSCFNGVSQNISIRGKAHASHIGKEVVLCDFSDYMTYSRTKESIDTVDKNGYFELKLQSKTIKPVLIQIENLVGKLYVQPDFVYGIYFPGRDSLTNNQEGTETSVNITVYGHDSTELNALIIDFNTRYNDLFLKSTDAYLSPAKINTMLDTFLVASRERYKHIKNPYFKTYLEYSFADFFSSTSRGKNLLYKQFIQNKPVLFSNYEYMQFVNSYYEGYLKAYASTKNGGSIYNSINAFADYQDLKNQFNADRAINNDTLRELVLLKGLMEFYYSPDFDKQRVQSVIEQFSKDCKTPDLQKISLNMLQSIYKLQPGADAPDFTAIDKNGASVKLLDYKGKYIYLNFFSTQSESSLKEMSKIVDLKKKFNDKVTFISVCLDDSIKTYKAYLKANPKFDWPILYQDKYSNAKQAYNIKTYSGFFFINLQRQLAQSPALMPSEGIEYKFKALFRPKAKNTLTGVR